MKSIKALSRILLVLFLMPIVLKAENRVLSSYNFTHIKSADGLPHQQISDMAFDKSGRLWIATRDGLGCYDGYSFTNYYHKAGDSTSLIHNFAQVLLVDSKGLVWVGTESGLCRYVPETDSFIQFSIKERIKTIEEISDGRILVSGDNLMLVDPADGRIKSLPHQDDGYVVGTAVAPDKRVFVATNKTIAYYDAGMKNCTFVSPQVYTDFLMGFDDIVPMFFDHRGVLWIGRSGKGVMSYDLKTGDTEIYDVPRISNGTVRAIAEDRNHNIWIGTEMGVNVIDPKTGEVGCFMPDLVNPHRLNDNAIYCVLPDDDNNIWIGTYFGGINVVHKGNNNFQWTAPGYDGTSLRGKVIRRIIEPEKGHLWMATEDAGINILDISTGNVERFSRVPAIGSNVHELYYDAHSGKMWIGTFRNGLFCYDMAGGSARQFLAGASGLSSNAIFGIVKQNTGGSSRLWIATTQGLRYYDPATDSFHKINHPILDRDFVYCLLVDSKERLWAGTVNSGLFRIDNPSGVVKGWNFIDTRDNSGLHDHYVTELYEGSDGKVYVGTNNGGLHVVGPDQEIKLLSAAARSFGTVCSMLQDSRKMLWVTTSRGLYRYDPANGNTVRYTIDDGLPENQFNFSSALQASDGKLYFGTVNGLVSFKPEVSKYAVKPVKVHLNHLYVNNSEVIPGKESPLDSSLDYTDRLVLPYSQSRSFSIDYGVVSPASAHTFVYQVYLEGIDRSWRDVGSLRQFSAMDLAPGTYKLKIRASTTPDGWNSAPVRELTIKIEPPLYLSPLAFLIYSLLVLIAAYFCYSFFDKRIKERDAIRISKMEQEKTEELNREKMEMFTNISHELKTPLSLILAPLKYLSQQENLSEDSLKRLNIAITNTNKMVGLIDELVTFNRVESGNFQMFIQYGNPLTFIEIMTQYFYEVAGEKNIAIHIYTENNGEDVWFSTTYLERILNNLLSNAIKYTGEGGEIDVRAAIREENERLYLCFSVRDNGIGIAPEETENIFRKYYQTGRGYKTNHSGWGIGLATVKRLVEMHKGSICVESKIGEGSIFKVRIDVSADAFDPSCRVSNGTVTSSVSSSIKTITRQIGRSETLPVSPLADSRISILLVEDNSELLSFLSDSYSKVYKVYTATNGAEALKIAEEYQVDIVVSDVMMPVMDGMTMCDHMKNSIAMSHIPVILLTAKNDAESTMRGYECGAEAYVSKPFDPQILELRIRNILRARRRFLNEVIDSGDAGSVEGGEDAPVLNEFDKKFITRISALVDSNIDNSGFAIADITKELGISRSLLHIKMKSFFNQSMTDYIRKKRLTYACKLLREGYNISETAYSSGYSDPNYFTKVFKKEFGITPSDYIAKSKA